jgi:hypothetical protein
MSDERFDRDLASVLRGIAGEEAPMSLRFRLSDITDRAPVGPRLWFATPMRLSMVAAAAVAVLALAIIFLPGEPVGPSPSDSPSVEPTPSVVPTPSLEPTAGPTIQPTPGPTGAPTPAPTAIPTPTGEWTGLVWSDAVTPSFTVHLYDLLPWGDGYVAVGEVPEQGPYASFTSPDGLNWTIEQRDFPGEPHHLVAAGDELLAFMPVVGGAPPTTLIWRSTDGTTWALVDSMSWEEAWHEAIPGVHSNPEGWDVSQHDVTIGLVDVASGPDGLVAIGNSFGTDAMEPIILHSSDGMTWTSSVLPAGSDSALLNSVVEHDGRFVVTGATGVWTDPTTARPAAWHSDDGMAWTRASVDDGGIGPAVGTEFGPLFAGADGLLTCRGNREMGAGGWRYMLEWVSTDGTSWAPAADIDENPGCSWTAGDGTRIVSLGPRAHAAPYEWPGVTDAWTSADGETWQELTVSSPLGDMLERFWVVPDGMIYAGEQSFWFGTAIGP